MLLPFGSSEELGTVIPLSKLGAEGMFVGIITAIIATQIYCKISAAGLTIKMPDSVPPMIAESFVAIIPGAAPLFLFNLIRYLFTFTSWGNAVDFVYEILQKPLMGLGGTLPAVLIAVLFTQFFWWFGIHGTLVVNAVIDPIMNALAIENYEAYKAGAEQLPHIINTTFMGVFVNQGMQLGISITMAFFIARSIRMKKLMKTVIAPSVFNVSEPMTFGLPIVLNPIAFVPWILAPLASTTISYFAIAAGLVPRPIGATVVWTTPVFLSGWLGTGSVAGAILQLVTVAVMTLIWVPAGWGLAFLLIFCFTFAFTWVSVLVGLIAKSPETATLFTVLITLLPYLSSGSSGPYLPFSRPKPECLTPPKGAAGFEIAMSLTPTIPYWRFWATSEIVCRFVK